jgi:hypothetical protein
LNPLNKVVPPDDLVNEVNSYEYIIQNQLAAIYIKGKEGTVEATDINARDLLEDLGTNDTFIGVGLIEETWTVYIEFMKVLSFTLKNFVEDPTIEMRKENIGIFLRKAYRAAILHANKTTTTSDAKLKNLWNRLGVERELPATSKYVRNINQFREDEFNRLWLRYRINEFYDRSMFSNTDKMKIMDAAIQSTFLISNLKYYGYLSSYFPLHNEYELTGWQRDNREHTDPIEIDLCKAMGREVWEYIETHEKFVIPIWKANLSGVFFPPVNTIRDYFGEKIAYYFDYLALYNKFVLVLVPIGICTAVALWVADIEDATVQWFIIIYAVINVLLSTVFIEFLKREEKFRATAWGTITIEEGDYIRPLFKGIFRRSPIDDDLNDPTSTYCNKVTRNFISWSVNFILSASAAGVSILIFWARYALAKSWEGEDRIVGAVFITAIAGSITIGIKDVFFKPICIMLTRFENKKTKAEFEASYVFKFFVFKCVNYYGPLLYIAFLKKFVTGCISTQNNFIREGNDCMWELRYELIFYFAFYMLQNINEIAMPFFKMYKAVGQHINSETTQDRSHEYILRKKVYIESNKSSYDDGEINGVIGEYFEIVMQGGMVFMFSIAFALIPLITVINNIFETYIDRAKILYLTQRPVQQSAKSHGIFTPLIEIISFISIFTNFGIMCFTAEAFGKDDKFTSFIWINVIVFVIRFILQELIPDEPEVVFNIKQRHRTIIGMTLGKQERTDSDMLAGEKTFFMVQNTFGQDGHEVEDKQIKEGVDKQYPKPLIKEEEI